MPHSEQDPTPAAAEGDLYTVLRPAISPRSLSDHVESAPAEAPGFLVPPVARSQAVAAGAVESARSAVPVRRVLPVDPALRQEPSMPARVAATPVRSRPALRVPSSAVGLHSSAPTVLITILFGLAGAIAAAIQTSNARKRGLETAMYWRAFGITMAISILVWIMLLVALFAWIASATTV